MEQIYHCCVQLEAILLPSELREIILTSIDPLSLLCSLFELSTHSFMQRENDKVSSLSATLPSDPGKESSQFLFFPSSGHYKCTHAHTSLYPPV